MMDDYTRLCAQVEAQRRANPARPFPVLARRLTMYAISHNGAWTTIRAEDGVHRYEVSFCGETQIINCYPLRFDVNHDDGTGTYYWRGRPFRLASIVDAPWAWHAHLHVLSKKPSKP